MWSLLIILLIALVIKYWILKIKVDNGIPILSYYDDESDDELKDLSSYLSAIKDFDDIREANKCLFKLNNYAYYETP